MNEAFDYACLHDRREENPQYCSMPTALGEHWAFHQRPQNGIDERIIESGTPTFRKCYDLQGRETVMPTFMEGKVIKKLNAKRAFGLPPVIIIKP